MLAGGTWLTHNPAAPEATGALHGTELVKLYSLEPMMQSTTPSNCRHYYLSLLHTYTIVGVNETTTTMNISATHQHEHQHDHQSATASNSCTTTRLWELPARPVNLNDMSCGNL
jgi:hypothetical protein